MQRYNSWLQTLTPDFWTEKFKPKDILRVTSHAASILSLPTDISLLARYDINEINEHTVGITKVWQEFEFGEPTYIEDEDYPYVYTIDENWLFLDAFYDAYVDPEINLQNEVDFKLTKGKLAFVKEVPKKSYYYQRVAMLDCVSITRSAISWITSVWTRLPIEILLLLY